MDEEKKKLDALIREYFARYNIEEKKGQPTMLEKLGCEIAKIWMNMEDYHGEE